MSTSGHVAARRSVGRRRAAALAAVVAPVLLPVVAGSVGLGAPAAAAPARTMAVAPQDPPGRDDCVTPGEVFTGEPWHQQLWDLRTARVRSRGAGATVAVLSSGVDGRQVQLRGHVERGRSFAPGATDETPGDVDCAGLGTGLASLLVAQPVEGVRLHGVAPDATVLPVVVGESTWVGSDPDDPMTGTTAALAAGIEYAVEAGSDVVLVGGYLAEDDPQVRRAVADARAAGVLVVAPVRDREGGFPGRSHPAAYPGVLGVSGMKQDLTMVPGSETGDAVDLVAPGDNLAVAARGSGHARADGNAAAAALAAGAAALVLSAEPGLNPDEVVARLRATAGPFWTEDPAVVGAGLLDVTRAVTESAPAAALPQAATQPAIGPAGLPEPDMAAVAAAREARERELTAVVVAAVAAAVALLLGGSAWVGRQGARRGWRPGRRVLPAAPDGSDSVPRPLFGTPSR